MPDGVKLGGAYFELTADSAPLIRAMAQAETRSKASAQAIAAATGIPEKAVARYAQLAIRSHQQIEAAEKRHAAQAEAAARRIEQAQQRAAARQTEFARGLVQGAAGIAGLTSAAAIATKAIDGITASTQRAAQTQFALAKTYGSSAAEMGAFTKSFSDEIKRSSTDVAQAAVIVNTLTRSYGLSQEQAKLVIRAAADLAAVHGKDLVDATQRLSAAVRGEAESAEALGLALNETRVATSQLGADGLKLWEKLTEEEKATLRLAEAMKQLAEQQGAAQERAAGAGGSFDRLNKVTDELGAAIGMRLIPVAAAAADVLSTMGEGALAALDALNDLSRLDLDTLTGIATALFNPAGLVAARIAGLKVPGDQARAAREQARAAKREQDKARAQAEIDANAAEIRERARQRAALDRRKKDADERVDAEKERIDAEKEANDRSYEHRRRQLDVLRAAELKGWEQRRDAAVEAIEVQRRADEKRFEEALRQAEQERDTRIQAAEAAKDAAITAIEEQRRAYAAAREQEDRDREDSRRTEERDLTDARRRADQQREDAQAAEMRRLEAQHEATTKGLDDEIRAAEAASQKRLRSIDRQADRARQASERAVRQIEQEADAARDAAEQVIRDIERRADAEQDRHRKALRNLDEEEARRLGVLDAQLKTLDAQDRAADRAADLADLEKRASEARLAVVRAQGTGTPQQVAAARGDLTTALQGGNELSVANARERLAQLAGQGADAVRMAQEELAAAEAAINEQRADSARDLERERIEVAQDAIRTEIAARKQAEEDRNRDRARELDADKEAEQDKLAATLDRLERQKQAEQDNVKSTLARLEDRKQAVQDATRTEIERIRERQEAERTAYEQTVTLARDQYEVQTRLIAEQRQVEDRTREDRQRLEDRDRADQRQKQDQALQDRQRAIEAQFEQERTAATAHHAIVTAQIRAAQSEAKALLDQRLEDVRRHYDAERDAINATYHNEAGTGLLDKLEEGKRETDRQLAEQVKSWEKWKRDVIAQIDEAAKRLAQLQAQGSAPLGTINGLPVQGPVEAGATNPLVSEQDVLRSIHRHFGFSNQAAADAVEVWSGEGRSAYVGDSGTSFGPFQLHTPGGLGDAFMRDTGLDPRNPSTVDAQIAWVANYVRRFGWNNQWHGAPGYNRSDPSRSTGIAVRRYALGGWITEPVVGVGMRSRAMYQIAERAPELVTPASRMIDRRPLLGAPPASNFAAMGAFMAASHPSVTGGAGGGIGYQDNKTINVNGVGVDEFMRRIKREEHRDSLLRGVRRLR